jgi:hypothetical protein
MGRRRMGRRRWVSYACDADGRAEMALAPYSCSVQAIQYFADVGGQSDQHLRSLAAHAHQPH